ncbi:hypothetical protein [Virgisporangium aurantiacum]|nr:hypothetical protein [Virgisporangium aurantiacum]
MTTADEPAGTPVGQHTASIPIPEPIAAVVVVVVTGDDSPAARFQR